MKDVYDASHKLMRFLGRVHVNTTTRGGKSSEVSFHISDMESDEVLLGPNAIDKLGVHIVISPEPPVPSQERPAKIKDSK